MNKFLTLAAAVVVTSATANAQSYIAGLNFNSLPDVSSDIAFDKGPQAGLFSLDIQSDADDNFAYFSTFTDAGWAAPGDILSDGVNSFPVGSAGTLPTVNSTAGFAASNSVFGGTSAFAQGFDATAGIAFTQATNGVFYIDVAQSINDFSLSFDVAALATQSQVAGDFTVNGQTVTAAAAAANRVVSLGNISAGSSIAFDLSGLNAGATFDNFMISGTVVPEPSAFASIFGVVALGFAACRRRS